MKNTSKNAYIDTTKQRFQLFDTFFFVIKQKKINKFFVWFSYISQSELREISAELK